MLTMDDIKYIRRMHEIEGISMREINRRTGYHMDTIKKYVEIDFFIYAIAICKTVGVKSIREPETGRDPVDFMFFKWNKIK